MGQPGIPGKDGETGLQGPPGLPVNITYFNSKLEIFT